MDRASKAFFHLLARNASLKRLASRHGMHGAAGFARRFVAGETAFEAIEAVRALEARGFTHTLDHLGESVGTLAEADAATEDYLSVMDTVVRAGVGRNLSLKLTQLGLDVDRATAVDNLRKILDRARADDFFIRIDMEGSTHTDATLDIFETLWRQGYRNMGTVLQSALYRTEQDLTRLNALGARIRLVKGAYNETRSVAWPRKADVDRAYATELRILLAEGQYPAIATHDPTLIDLTRRVAAERALGPDHFEFQMLYGIRRDLQGELVSAGYRVRIYVPFGREWFPYFMRRLGERPANVMFVVRSLLRETA